MQALKAKENILKKIRAALVETTPVPYVQSEGNSNLFVPPHDDWTVIFAEELSKLDGKFLYVENETALVPTLHKLLHTIQATKVYCVEPALQQLLATQQLGIALHPTLESCHVSITTCESLVARTGTIVLSSAATQGRTASVYCPIHICIAYTSQLVYDTKDALNALKEKYKHNLPSVVSFATGPSRTADIEKTLVKGIHGPKDVYCILIDK